MSEDAQGWRFTPGLRTVWLLIGLFALVVVLAAAWILLEWNINEFVYTTKAGLDWFSIAFYHGYLFVAAGLFALLAINPRFGRSDLWGPLSEGLARWRGTEYEQERKREWRMSGPLWVLWQVVKWSLLFNFMVNTHAFPLLGEAMNAIMMLVQGLGSWSGVAQAFFLPAFPASGSELVQLMPVMEIQYRVLSYVASALILVFAGRMLIRLLANLTTRRSSVWTRNLLSALAAFVSLVILGAPYWLMNAATPYIYGIAWVAFVSILLGWVYVGRRPAPKPPRLPLYKIAGVVLAGLFVVQAGTGAFLYFNWNNNYLQYQWYPQTQKAITVTRWSAGLDQIHVNSLLGLPSSNSSSILSLVRQWDQQAATVTNTKAIGAYNWMSLGSSEIVFYRNSEYWVSPTTPAFPSTDWISQHLIYTHASKILLINTHNGSEVSPPSAFGIGSEPAIYYGDGGGFDQSVYVHVPGYEEVQNVSYTGAPDYALSGWQKAMWFTFAEGQLGFAFQSQQVDMLWNRNIFNRVQSVLIPGLVEDPAAYIASDGKNVYFVVQVYIDYPLRSGFAVSDYLRFFGVVLVNVTDGTMQGYNVSNLIGGNGSDFITSYYQNYYSGWKAPPSWLVPQLRYPEQLLGSPSVPGQLDYDFVFHVSDPFVFRSGTQFYERPADNTVQYIPWVVGNKAYFVGMQLVHFQSAVSRNLAGMYVAYGGDKLGQIDLFQNPSESTPIIGPSAAENALTTNSQVRTQITLLPNYRFGTYLLYSVGGTLVYFVAVYTNPGTSGVVTQLPFMTAVNPETAVVAVGQTAAAAYQKLAGVNETAPQLTARDLLLKDVGSLASSEKYSLVNATSVNPTVWVNVATVSLSKLGVNQTLAKVGGLLSTYGPASANHALYVWVDSSGSLNFGLLQSSGPGVVELHYVTVQP